MAVQRALTGLVVEETTVVGDRDLASHIRKGRKRGGRLRMCSPCGFGGEPGWAVTMRYPS